MEPVTGNDGGSRLEKINIQRRSFPRPKTAVVAGKAGGNTGCELPKADNQSVISQKKHKEKERMQLVNTFITNVMAFLDDKKEEAGQTLVEYALIIALISLLVIGLAAIVAPELTNTFNDIADGLAGS